MFIKLRGLGDGTKICFVHDMGIQLRPLGPDIENASECTWWPEQLLWDGLSRGYPEKIFNLWRQWQELTFGFGILRHMIALNGKWVGFIRAWFSINILFKTLTRYFRKKSQTFNIGLLPYISGSTPVWRGLHDQIRCSSLVQAIKYYI